MAAGDHLRALAPARGACDGLRNDRRGPDRLLTGEPGLVHVGGNTEDVLSEIAERGWTVRVLPPRAAVPAVAIAQLARTRAPSPTPHALAPDYGETPAVTQRKS